MTMIQDYHSFIPGVQDEVDVSGRHFIQGT